MSNRNFTTDYVKIVKNSKFILYFSNLRFSDKVAALYLFFADEPLTHSETY